MRICLVLQPNGAPYHNRHGGYRGRERGRGSGVRYHSNGFALRSMLKMTNCFL